MLSSSFMNSLKHRVFIKAYRDLHAMTVCNYWLLIISSNLRKASRRILSGQCHESDSMIKLFLHTVEQQIQPRCALQKLDSFCNCFGMRRKEKKNFKDHETRPLRRRLIDMRKKHQNLA